MELTKFLLHHPENRKNPKCRRISVHEDIPDEEEECELLGKSEEATLNPNSSGSSLGESYDFGTSEGTGQEDSDENSSAESLPGHNSPNAIKNKVVPMGKKGLARVRLLPKIHQKEVLSRISLLPREKERLSRGRLLQKIQ